MKSLGFLAATLVLVVPAFPATALDLDTALSRLPESLLRTEYHPVVRRPLEYVGYSFGGPRSELEEMKRAGATAVGQGEMWNPIRDPEAPFGMGVAPLAAHGTLAQTFTAEEAFDACAPTLPTSNSSDSGCSWRLYRVGEEKPLAEGTWPLLVDNGWADAAFTPMPPGRYRFEIHTGKGTSVGWWARSGNPYAGGTAHAGGKAFADIDFEFRIRAGGAWHDVVAPAEPHQNIVLGPSQFDHLEELGLGVAYSIGNWNNPGFTYYPEWFFDEFPETRVLDQHGEPFLGGGMFGKTIPSPNIDSAVIVNGTRRMLTSRAAARKDSPNLLYYVMGGEDLYATYMDATRITDYSDNAQAHFRAWLRDVRYTGIDALNASWGTGYPAFDDVEPPRLPAKDAPWLDWLDFRFEAMGERFGWHYQAIREADPSRYVMTCNHGTLYHGQRYAHMGARLEQYAAQSDGFETGQIMEDNDPDYYNLLYTESITSLGKPYCPVRLAYKKSNPMARGGGTSYTPEAVRRYGYETLGSGAWHLGFIQWSGSLPDGEWGVKGTPGEQATAQFHREIAAMADELDGLHAVRPMVGVFLSHRTWALDGFLPSWHAFHKAAIHNHLPKAYLYDGQVLSGEINDYPILLSIDNDLSAPGILEGLLRYVERGGRLLVTGDLPEEFRGLEGVRYLPKVNAAGLVDACGTEPLPVILESDGRTRRPIGFETAPQGNDRPDDLTSASSLGQTFVAEYAGLQTVSIITPTYTKVPPAGFLLELRMGGPDGRVIASREVPAGIGDNAWVDLQLEESPPEESKLYVSATAPEGLPEQSIGWWTSNNDVYTLGEAYAGGQPTTGERRVKLSYEAPVPAPEAVEVFHLSDGINHGIVLVNTGLDPVDLKVQPGLTMRGVRETDAYAARTLVRPGDVSEGRVRIPAQDAEVLYFAINDDEATVRWLLDRELSRRHVLAQKDALTPYHQDVLNRAVGAAASENWDKCVAFSARAGQQIGLSVACPEVIPKGETALIVARFYGPQGEPVAVDEARAEFTPTQGLSLEMQPRDEGEYILSLSADQLPKLYNYLEQRYERFGGPLRIRVSGRAGGMQASRLVDVMVGGTRYPAGGPDLK